MSRVLEKLKDEQRAFTVSPFVTFLQDSYFTPRMRLGFLPCVAPLVMELPKLGRTLRGEQVGAQGLGAGPQWGLYLKDLQTLGLEVSPDLTGTLRLVWGEEGRHARATLLELVTLCGRLAPMQRHVARLALEAVGGVLMKALGSLARDLKVCTGRQLLGLEALRLQALQEGWGVGEVALDLSAAMEPQALELVGEVFRLSSALGDELLEYVQRKMAVDRDPLGWERTASLTFHEFGSARLQALCESVGYRPEDTAMVQRFFSALSSGWGAQRIGSNPEWLSEVTDDHTPYEFSVALEEGHPEVRFLIEAQAQQGTTTLESSWQDGLALNERLRRDFGVPLERFEQVKDLFEPRDPAARFSLWHAFCLKAGGVPALKVYLNPKARGPEHSNALVEEALARLGFTNAWNFISRVALRRGAKDQLVYFSLDLSAHRAARIKVYISHQDATAEDVEALMAEAKEYVPGEAQAFVRRLQGAEARFSMHRSTQTCLSFTSDDDARPYGVHLYVPIRCYADNDLDAMWRIRGVLEPGRYALLERAVQSLAHRPLDAGVGLIQWAAMRRENGKARTTFYLATEAYSHASARVLGPQEAVFIPRADEPSPARPRVDA